MYLPLLAVALLFGSPAFASQCEYIAPQRTEFNYMAGDYLPVITGRYQFDLPGKPESLLFLEGLIARYADGTYVSYRLISTELLDATLSRFQVKGLTARMFELYVFGVLPLAKLSPIDQSLLKEQRSLLGLDCRSRVALYTLPDGGEVILHEASDGSLLPNAIMYFGGESVGLLQVKGGREFTLNILRSIKARGIQGG